jgi:hypothetical protein
VNQAELMELTLKLRRLARKAPLFLRNQRTRPAPFALNRSLKPNMLQFRLKPIRHSIALGLSAAFAIASVGTSARAHVLLDEKWSDGRRTENQRPKEAAVWVGRKAEVTMKPGVLSTANTSASQKMWLYFTDKEPVKLTVGQKLIATVSFIARGSLNQGTSRGLRVGLFYDPTGPRVESDTNSDGGGNDAPWTDAKGYAAQVLIAGADSRAKPFDLGKRTNLASKSLLGTSSDYTKLSGGEPVELKPDTEYSIVLEVQKTSENEAVVTSTYKLGQKELSRWSVTDDGNNVGPAPICDSFDMLFVRISNKETTAEKIEFTNFKVELVTDEKANSK